MKLEGIHHITAITADAPGNVDFYAARARACGSSRRRSTRTTRPSTTSSTPTSAGARAATSRSSSTRARAAAAPAPGWCTASSGASRSEEALDFWAERLADEGVATERADGSLRFADPEGLDLELVVYDGDDEPLAAEFPGIPREHALQGFHGVRAYASEPGRRAGGCSRRGSPSSRTASAPGRCAATSRGSFYVYDEPPAERGIGGAGTIHHVAWASTLDEHEAVARAARRRRARSRRP